MEDDTGDASLSVEEVTVIASSHTFITFSMPASQGRKRLFVQVGDLVSNSTLFTYSPPVLQGLFLGDKPMTLVPTAGYPEPWADSAALPAILRGSSFGSPCPVSKPYCGHGIKVEVRFSPITLVAYPDADSVSVLQTEK